MNITDILKDHYRYWAHLPPSTDSTNKQNETLAEHCNLVNQYAAKLCKTHHLHPIVDKLIEGLLPEVLVKNKSDSLKQFIKEMFFNSIAFHDFGKINDNFQVLRMKNQRDFTENKNSKLNPSYGHSLLGTYIFIAYYLEKLISLELEDSEARVMIFILALSYPILCHHRPALLECYGDLKYSNLYEYYHDLKKYLQELDITYREEVNEYFLHEDFEHSWDDFFLNNKKGFPLFALIKLNFSLLTASDYLATHEYMSDEQTMDFGVFNNRDRTLEIINNLRTSQIHNQETYSNINNYEFSENALQSKSKTNLNKLRKDMAVELVHNIRKNHDKRLFYIEAPTGGGKTNLSMIALTELMEANSEINKVYYVFPFTTLITQTHKALIETLGLTEKEIVELHSKAAIHSKELISEEKNDGEFGPAKKDFIDNLFALYPMTVLSHVKFFDILKSNRKESNYLLHRLANSIVIIDELQTYNPKIWDKILYLINEYSYYFNIRFILMSATLPKISELTLPGMTKPEFVNLLPHARKYITNPNFAERVKFNFELFENEEIELEQLANIVLHKSQSYASKNKNVHTIIEFIYKKSASEFYDIISTLEEFFAKIFVLSGTILESERRKIISYLKLVSNRNQNILLITTQVVEAGVDIDMDLGFKNISLLDSDEQLAGRVNRNASKQDCEVYIFKKDDPKQLYQNDDRFEVTRNKISQKDYETILIEKDFRKLYQMVFELRDNFNKNSGWADNFENNFHKPGINKLDFKVVDNTFKIIDQQNESVFVPIELPWNQDSIFENSEIQFLLSNKILFAADEYVQGKRVWGFYESLILQKHDRKEKGFDMNKVMKFKKLHTIMSKFTFSLFSHSKTVDKIKSLGFGEARYGYLYLNPNEKDLNRIYTLEGGLSEKELNNDNENLFL